MASAIESSRPIEDVNAGFLGLDNIGIFDLQRMPELMETLHRIGPGHQGVAEWGILALINPERLRRILTKMLDENEFFSHHGIRSISKYHKQNP